MVKRRKKKKRRRILILLIVLVLAGGGVWKFFLNPGAKKNPTLPISLKKGAVVDRLTETGTVEYETIVLVKSAISGRVMTLNVDEGQEVKLNDTMAVIQPDPDQALRLSEKAVSVRTCKIMWKQKEKQHQRLSELFKKELISQEQLEDSKDELDLAKQNYELARLQLRILEEEVKTVESQVTEGEVDPQDDDSSEIMLQDFKLQAPLAGMVISRTVEEGDMVIRGTSSFTMGNTLFTIGDPRKIIVASMINEIDVAKLSVGVPVKIIPNADEQRTYKGKVEKISPAGQLLGNIVNFRVEILVLEPDPFLKQSMTCDVDIVLGEREDVYYLPVEAVLKEYKKDKEGNNTKQIEKYMVFKKTGAKYEKIDVQVGLKSETRMEILSGLAPEDKVFPDAEKKEKASKKEEKKPGVA
jgi:multidrug resistance efflux pump